MAIGFVLGKTTVTIYYAFAGDSEISRLLLPFSYGNIIKIEGLSASHGGVIDLAVTNYGGVFYYGLEREFSEIEITFDGAAATNLTKLRQIVLTNLACGNRIKVISNFNNLFTMELEGIISQLDFPMFQKGFNYTIKIELTKDINP